MTQTVGAGGRRYATVDEFTASVHAAGGTLTALTRGLTAAALDPADPAAAATRRAWTVAEQAWRRYMKPTVDAVDTAMSSAARGHHRPPADNT